MQPATRYTTQRLSAAITAALPPPGGHRLALASIVVALVVLAIAGAVTQQRQTAAAPPGATAPLVVIWTVTPAPTRVPQPTATPAPEPTPVVIRETVYIEVQAAPAQEQPPEPAAEEWHPPLVLPGESMADYAYRNAIDTHTTCGGPDVVPPACH
jgi:hypothetical protein